MPTPVKMVEPTGLRDSLRIFWGDFAKKECPGPAGYHNAFVPLADRPYVSTDGVVAPASRPADHPDEAEWPKRCDVCSSPIPSGYFLNERGVSDGTPHYQVFVVTLYDTPPRPLRPGDMFWAGFCEKDFDPRGHLWIRMPDGGDWDSMSTAKNCPHGFAGKREPGHQCWAREGRPEEPAMLSFSPSIDTGTWHGYLKNGILTP